MTEHIRENRNGSDDTGRNGNAMHRASQSMMSARRNGRRGGARRVLLASAAVVLILSMVLASFVLIPPASAPQLDMTVLTNSVKEVSYGERAIYAIDVQNRGDENGLFHMELSDVPDAWDAELSADGQGASPGTRGDLYLDLEGNAHETVYLTVTAPTAEEATRAERDGGLDRVAAIGVRGGNVSVGTMTVLTGTVKITDQDGNVTMVRPADGAMDVLPGDIVNATGVAIIDVNFTKLFSDIGNFTGNLFVGLNNATVGFWVQNGSAHMWVERGKVIVLGGGGGGGGVRGDDRFGGTRAGSPTDWSMLIGRHPGIDTDLPGLAYNAVLSFGTQAGDTLMSMDVEENGTTTAAVYNGCLEVEKENETITLDQHEAVTGTRGEPLPHEPDPVNATLIEVTGDGSTQQSVTVGGDDVYNAPGAHVLKGAGGRDIYIIPSTSEEVSVNHKGTDTGTYGTRFTAISDYSVRSFDFSSSSTVDTDDIITMSRDMVSMQSAEDNKEYDLAIEYADRGGNESSFTLENVRSSSEDEQEIEVENWNNLGSDDAEPVTFTEGDVTVTVKDGETGSEIDEKISKGSDDGEPISVFGWAALIMAVLLVAGFLIMMGKKRQDGDGDGDSEIAGAVSDEDEWTESGPGTATDEGPREMGEPLDATAPPTTLPMVDMKIPDLNQYIETVTREEQEQAASEDAAMEGSDLPPPAAPGEAIGEPAEDVVPEVTPGEEEDAADAADEERAGNDPDEPGSGEEGVAEPDSDVADMPDGPAEQDTMEQDAGEQELDEPDVGDQEFDEPDAGDMGSPVVAPVVAPAMAPDASFPLKVNCHQCEKVLTVRKPAVFRCNGCGGAFKIDDEGRYLRGRNASGASAAAASGVSDGSGVSGGTGTETDPANVASRFPCKVDCHTCGRSYSVTRPAVFKCTGCGDAFKIDDEGRYLKEKK